MGGLPQLVPAPQSCAFSITPGVSSYRGVEQNVHAVTVTGLGYLTSLTKPLGKIY